MMMSHRLENYFSTCKGNKDEVNKLKSSSVLQRERVPAVEAC